MALEIAITGDAAGQTLAGIVRARQPGLSWSQAKRFVEARRVRLNGELCLDPARKVREGDRVELLDRPARLPGAIAGELVVRHLDAHVVVVEKPAGINTVRHPQELHWDQKRRDRDPTLEDRLQKVIAQRLGTSMPRLPRLRKVHRLDKLTSGLVVFARSALAEQELGRQFARHTVHRRYLAVVPGRVASQTVRSWLIRDRGDGRRGSSPVEGRGKEAVTHIEATEYLPRHTLLTCRLETGRTHQIRIHLAELGHPVCGDPVYVLASDGTRVATGTDAPRLALHAVALGFTHPATKQELSWDMPPPPELARWIESIRHGHSVD